MNTKSEPKTKDRSREWKVVVWDLDNTLWEGILLENDDVELKPGIKEIIETLDSRGILHSIASHNEYSTAMAKLEDLGLTNYYLYPEINWNAKSVSIQRIRENLNIGMDTILFIDDSPFERDEVYHTHPQVTCMDAADYQSLLQLPGLNPRFITEDSRRRRAMYLEDIRRKEVERTFLGPRQDFLATLGIQLWITLAEEEDLQRAEELTQRTNQLNTTGLTYGYEELLGFVHSPSYKLLVCEMKDRYGAYGKIGLVLIEVTDESWHLRLFLMSCRVLPYGVGTVVLSHIMQEAQKAGKKLRADFIPTGRNEQMYVTFKFANFRETAGLGTKKIVLENDLSFIQRIPRYVDLKTG
jgi:FkbH-like protein